MRTLPKLAKADRYDEGKALGLIRDGIALVNETLDEGASDPKTVKKAYAQLSTLIEWDLHDRPFALLSEPALVAEWEEARGRIHEVVYGYRPSFRPKIDVARVFPEIDAAELNAALDLIAEVTEYADGGTIKQVANEAAKAAKAAGVSLPKKQILRLTAFLEGGPIPPA